jgi:RHS repeat-associated protein
MTGFHEVEDLLSTPTGAFTRFVEGPGIDQHLASQDNKANVSYYIADHLGSVLQITNAAGQTTLTRDYDPYGVPVAAATQDGYAFTGREWDPETSLYYYRARYYDPNTGRFLSEDPIRGALSLYAYVRNSPAGDLDPSGRQAASPSPSPMPQMQLSNRTPPPELVEGFQEALHRLESPKCCRFFCGQGRDKLISGTKYYVGPFDGTAQTDPGHVLVQINSAGPFFTFTSGSFAMPGGVTANLGSVTAFRAFILLHELGHELSGCTGFVPDKENIVNTEHSLRVIFNCFS